MSAQNGLDQCRKYWVKNIEWVKINPMSIKGCYMHNWSICCPNQQDVSLIIKSN